MFGKIALYAAVGAAVLTINSVHAIEFGEKTERLLNVQSMKNFGIRKSLSTSAEGSVERVPGQDATDLVELAEGLSGRILTRDAGHKTDMMVLWPNATNPTHLVTCVEEGRRTLDDGRLEPSVQRINLATGAVVTMLRGMSRCDGIRGTAWGSILATEETSDGAAYEILQPLATTEEIVQDRGATGGDAAIITEANGTTPSANVAKRPAMMIMAWEGLAVLDSGVTYGGDELRPGSGTLDSDGGAMFKFIPTNPWTGSAINNLAASPFAAGSVYAYQASCRERTSSGFPQYGQGCEIGDGAWVKVNAATAREDANNNGATGYYRPEDGHLDPLYTGSGVRFCWTNTGRAAAANYGEVMCMVDENPLPTVVTDAAVCSGETVRDNGLMYLADGSLESTACGTSPLAIAVANRFLEGDEELNAPDNFAFQPVTGISYVIEDNANGDVWACLPDSDDRDIKTDGCIRVLSVKDRSAEPTGFMFDASGKRAYVAIQHSNDDSMPEFDGFGTDDIIEITGFRILNSMKRTSTFFEGNN